MARSILESAGHEIFVAEDGQQALSVFGGIAIDVVVTDLEMPRAHGLELITVLREASPRPGIIAISGTGYAQLDPPQSTFPVEPHQSGTNPGR